MNGMAIWADGSQVFDRVYFVLFAETGEFTQMMNVNHRFAYFSVEVCHFVSAYRTGPTMMFNALRSGASATLVGIDGNGSYCAFTILD